MKSLFFAFSLVACFFVSTSITASPNSNPTRPEVETLSTDESFVFVHITAVFEIQKRNAKGIVAKIVDLKAGKVANKGKNEFHGSIQIKDGKLQLHLDRRPKKNLKVIMPEGFQISMELSKKLGRDQQVVMSGGSTMLKPQVDSMLWFEIQ